MIIAPSDSRDVGGHAGLLGRVFLSVWRLVASQQRIALRQASLAPPLAVVMGDILLAAVTTPTKPGVAMPLADLDQPAFNG
jgi:hypothetical protein